MKAHHSVVSPSLSFLSAWLCSMAILFAVFVPAMTSRASTDYPPAIYREAYPGHWYTSGYGKRFYVIHDMEGYYWGTIYWFQRSTVYASVHYCTNGKVDNATDSPVHEVTQMVRDAYYAWHALCWNQHTMGTEHEGFASNPAWYTEGQYISSASITKSKTTKYAMPKDRNHIIAHGQKSISSWVTWMRGQGYADSFTLCQNHTDPGPYWQWGHYMDLVNGVGLLPNSPSSLALTVASASQINLAWVDNSGVESGFKIERAAASGGPFSQIGTVGANVRSYAAGGLASGTRYWFRVRAYNSLGNSAYSNTANATTKDTIPAAPTALTATAVSDVQINLAWAQAMPNEDGFRIYRSSDGTNYTLITTVGINAVAYNNSGLTGNRKYWYKVHAYNTAGNSAASNIASDTTAPQAPSLLVVNTVAGTANWNKLALSWTDNASSEVGFKVERGTAAAGPFTQIGTNATGVTTYTDTGLAATTTYYYRVRSYNANGNSTYSNVGSRATPNAPPILSAVGNKTVLAGNPLNFTVTASDPNAQVTTTTWQNFTAFPHNSPAGTVLFNNPNNSATTSAFLDTTTTYSQIFTNGPSAWGSGNKALKAGWGFKTGVSDYWIRLTTFNAPTNPNPAIALDQKLQFKFYGSKDLRVGLGVRETGTTAAYGANGGSTGAIEWVGVTNVVNGHPVPSRYATALTPVTLAWDLPFEPIAAFTGNGDIPENNVKGVLEHVILRGAGGTGAYSCWFDDFAVVVKNNNAFTLDAGAPAGTSIGYRTGKFTWTPTTGQAGVHNITVRVTDRLGGQDFETIKVTVTGVGNAAPVLAAIGNKTINEGTALGFTATATDADAGQTKTFSLDAGNPAGSSINSSSGVFAWTPTEAQGPGSYPITIRVTDNGSPVSNDFETITVAVNEINVAPVLSAIANQTINEGSPLNLTASATDSDLPANSKTYSIAGPVGMTINSGTGAISYTPGEDDGGDINQVTVTVKDNGNPVLSASRTFNVTVAEVNASPVLTLATTKESASPVTDFESDEDAGYNGVTMFRYPTYSSTTSAFIDPANDLTTVIENYPDIDVNTSAQVLHLKVGFLSGVNPWCRLTTHATGGLTNTFDLPNPTIDLGKHLRFKVWTDRSVKIGLGVRETGTSMPIGANGGTTGTIEWVGVSGLSGTAPNPSRVVAAGSWTTLDFNLPAEIITAFTGNGILASGKGTLEHLALVPNAGTGVYNIYFDDFEVVDISTNFTVDAGGTITLNNTATDSDLPAQELTFSLGTGAPTNAFINSVSGVFTWSPHGGQAPSTNLIPVIVTDNGSPNASDTKTLQIVVNKVNTAPQLSGLPDHLVEVTSGETVLFDAGATDSDVPANTLTFSLVAPFPAGATINPTTGSFSWTPTGGYSTNTIIVRVQDNGVPTLYDEQPVNILVIPVNTPPSLSLGSSRVTEPVFTFETFAHNTANESVLFKKPANSGTTLSYIDTAITNYTRVTTSFPAGNANAAAKVMQAGWTFKTGMSDYWVRLTTFNTTVLPNPTINASARLKFDIHTSKALKVGLGIRETGTTAENGANGGTTGTVEWVGISSIVGTTPQPTRTVPANTWTTVEFDLPNEPKQAFPASGNGVLNGGQQVLEHLTLVGAGGTGAYTVYFDNFEVVTTPALPGTVTMKVNSTFQFTAAATDPDPGTGLSFGLDADFVEGHPTATFDITNGVFNWKPATGDANTTNNITVTVQDHPNNGAVIKNDAETITVIVKPDALGPQTADDGLFVAGGASLVLTWESVPGEDYQVQLKSNGSTSWSTVQTVNASGSTSSFTLLNSGVDAQARVVMVGSGSGE